ncbi:BQ2448_879 [Microbotryum intermedium]|uniref:BQ2448_879 protein n=1 Tax=Microbotryum intermedium TaxID=269621 RepID=A0A238FC87_9BASI|nr:BQ2448_879 [Microbotryum intermedium]
MNAAPPTTSTSTALSAIIRNKRFLGLLIFILVCGTWTLVHPSTRAAFIGPLLPSRLDPNYNSLLPNSNTNANTNSAQDLLNQGSRSSGGTPFAAAAAGRVAKLLSGKSEPQIEAELDRLEQRHKAVRDDVPDVTRLDLHADRFKVVVQLDQFDRAIDGSPLNVSMRETYHKTTRHLRDDLFATLYPYVSRNENHQRTFDDLLMRYSRSAGIVIPCGNDHETHFRFSLQQWAVHLIATLKDVHKTKLPIIVAHSGQGDLTVEKRAALRSLSPDVETVDLLHIFDEKHVRLENSGWAIKPFAILASPFKETIICDADAIFLQDPAILLTDPGYQQTGTLFFRDREIFPGDGNVHAWFKELMKGRKPSKMLQKSRWWLDEASREEMESGVVVVNKGRRDVALGMVFVGFLNTRDVRDAVMYRQTYGDKESYWMGYELGGVPYYFDPPYAGIAGRMTHLNAKGHTVDSRICSEHHLHLDYKGRPLWWNGSLYEDKRHREKGWFLALHYTHGTVDWDCEPEPWCMKGIREEDVKKFSEVRLEDGTGFDRILSDMIGAALVAELKFPK